MCEGRALAGLERQPRLCAVERLDLTFLVDRQHDRVARRRHVKPDHVVELGGEARIGRALEGANAVGLETVRAPDPLHRGQRQATHGRHGATGPVRGFTGRLARERALQHGLHLVLRCRGLAGRSRLVAQQAIQALLGEALLPAPDRRTTDADLSGHRQHGQAFVRQQHDPCTENMGERSTAVVDDPAQRVAGLRGQHKGDSLGHAAQTRTIHTRRESPEWVGALVL